MTHSSAKPERTTAEERDCETASGWGGACREARRPSMWLWCRPCLIADLARAEAQAARYREALGHVKGGCENLAYVYREVGIKQDEESLRRGIALMVRWCAEALEEAPDA